MLDDDGLTEQEREEKKRNAIEARIKKRNTTLFVVVAWIFEIVVTMIVLLALFILFAVVIFKFLPFSEITKSVIMEISTIFIFFGGLVLGFMIYRNCTDWVIRKFNLQDKIVEKTLKHYIKEDPIEKMKR
jgi:uncharacterized membrane protein